MLGEQVTEYIAKVGQSVAVHDTALNGSMLGMVTADGDVMLARIPNEDEYAIIPQSPVWEDVRDDRTYLVWTGPSEGGTITDVQTNTQEALRGDRRDWVRDQVNRRHGARFDAASNAELLDSDEALDAVLDASADWFAAHTRDDDQ